VIDSASLYSQYHGLLLDDVVPFWFRHGIDWKYGGVLSCLRDDGSRASDDKFIWSQARSVWTFSALYNRIERRPEFLEAAENSVRFLLSYGRDDRGRWAYRTDRKGQILEGATSIYSDCFVVYGFSEYFRAARDERILDVALETFEYVQRRVEDSDFHETAPYPLPQGWRCHGIPMILTEVSSELAQTAGDRRFESLADEYSERVMEYFLRSDKQVILEFLTHDYAELQPPAGTFVMPGHAIESMWFVMHLARRRGNREGVFRAAEVMRRHLELGWDREFGGIFLSRDIGGNEPYLPHSEKKMWWPHVEALYGTLLACELTQESWCSDWYEKVAEWTWAHFPVPEYGEWYQRLNRQGAPTAEVVALPVKDPFHLPRAAILILQLLERTQANPIGNAGDEASLRRGSPS
jgi:N-acylglucosamine 2-epimerase